MLPRVLVALLFLMLMGGCTVTVHPPISPEQPVDVFIIDYGRHSSLLLPNTENEGLVEFAYGDWKWYALAQDGPLDVFPTLFLPTQGALGRLSWSVEPDAVALKRAVSCEVIHTVTVERDKAAVLLDRLESRYRSNIETRRESELYYLFFVHDDQPYCLLNHCNHTTRKWLEELG